MSKAASKAMDDLCERSSEELRRELDRLREATGEPIRLLRRRARHFKRDALGMDVTDDSGAHDVITVPNRTIVVVADPFPSPTDIARPSRPSR